MPANIKIRRVELGLTQRELAARLGTNQMRISRIERQARGARVTEAEAQRIAAALDVPASKLFDVDDGGRLR